MLKKAIKTTWDVAAFDDAACLALLASITTALTDAGFAIIGSSSTDVEFMPAGAAPAHDTNDDTPHWAITSDNTATIQAWSIHGLNKADLDSRLASFTAIPDTFTSAAAVSRFYCDASSGEWWLHLQDTADASKNRMIVGTAMRRYPADTTQNIHARYGLLRADYSDALAFTPPYFYPPYYTGIAGDLQQGQAIGVYSPLAGMCNNMAQKAARHSASPLPPSAAPLFPHHLIGTPSACVLGEFTAAQLITADDYTVEQELSPGWIAMPGNANLVGLAVPTCAFTVVADPRVPK